jgi:hypothetical protein
LLRTVRERILNEPLIYVAFDLFLGPEDFLAVILQLIYRFFDVRQRDMGLLLFKAGKRGIPSFDQFLYGAYIDGAIVKEFVECVHMPGQKPSILPYRVSAQGGLSFLTVKTQEIQGLLLCLPAVIGRCLDPACEAGCLMVASTPLFHVGKDRFGVVYRYAGAFCHEFQIIISNDGCNFQNDMVFRVHACHFKIYPDQMVVQLGPSLSSLTDLTIERLPSVWRKTQVFLQTLQGPMWAPEVFVLYLRPWPRRPLRPLPARRPGPWPAP